MTPGLKRLLSSPVMILLLFRLVRLYASTFRLTVENEEPWLEHLRAGGRVLLCAWHQQFFAAVGYFHRYRSFRPSIMISQSSDGGIAAGVAERIGWHAVRGSSSHNGLHALREMIARLRRTGLAAHIVDGPRGPFGVVKPGVIRMAQITGAVIVPVYTFAENAWYLNSWDRFLLPKPFTRVRIVFDRLFTPSPRADQESMESERRRLERIMSPALGGGVLGCLG